MPDLKTLALHVGILDKLLADKDGEGTMAWNLAVAQRWKAIADAYYGPKTPAEILESCMHGGQNRWL